MHISPKAHFFEPEIFIRTRAEGFTQCVCQEKAENPQDKKKTFSHSKLITRGGTLPELLAKIEQGKKCSMTTTTKKNISDEG